MKNLVNLMNEQQADRNPGCNIGKFLIDHSISLEYLVGQLTAYLEAAKADLKHERDFYRKLSCTKV